MKKKINSHECMIHLELDDENFHVEVDLSIELVKEGIGHYEYAGAPGFDEGGWSISDFSVNSYDENSVPDYIKKENIETYISYLIDNDINNFNEKILFSVLKE